MKKLFLLSFILMLFVSCNKVEEYEFESVPDILALMKASDSLVKQKIFVDQSYDIQDIVDQAGVGNALVRIWDRYDTFVFADTYYDSALNKRFRCAEGQYVDWIRFNDTALYTLEVVLPWDDTVTAQAYMPSPIQISAPADSDTVSISQEPYDPHAVAWNSCRNTELYLIYCIPDVDTSELDDISPLYSLPSFTTDTSYTFFAERMVFPWDFNMHYVLRVIAVTPEYIDYMGFLNPTGESCSNLSSGYGMFGGISEDSIRVFVTE